MILREYRVVLPLTTTEYNIGQLYATAEASRDETGGGEGIEILVNSKYDIRDAQCKDIHPNPLFFDGDLAYAVGQYTLKKIFLAKRAPSVVGKIFSSASFELEEHSWNSFPYCRTIYINKAYSKDTFSLKMETMNVDANVNIENIHQLSDNLLRLRKVYYIDISDPSYYSKPQSAEKYDARNYVSQKAQRGPIGGPQWWLKVTNTPIMCSYKLLTFRFEWFGLQTVVENYIHRKQPGILNKFNRHVYCSLDSWYGMTLDEIREYEDDTKEYLREARLSTVVSRGYDLS